jgi:AraC-like DNA-binding protein
MERGWIYRQAPAGGPVELGFLDGGRGTPAVGRHFHDEVQVTLVLAGTHGFRIGAKTVEAGAGEGIVIPPGLPHTPIARPAPGAVVLNAYLPPEGFPAEVGPALDRRVRDWLASENGVGALADLIGLSREQFTRRFGRSIGMPPHAYRLMRRLNAARTLLRAGEMPAGVAAETGFADQSHLGRHFRRAFGISPGAYRMGFFR